MQDAVEPDLRAEQVKLYFKSRATRNPLA
jgi:hypothetical protein